MNLNVLAKKCQFLIILLILGGCKTTSTQCQCPIPAQSPSRAGSEDNTAPAKSNLTPEQSMELATQLLNSGAAEEAVNVLNAIPEKARDSRYKKLRRDAVNKIVMNMRYKVRILYEKSLQEENKIKRDLLLQCKRILELIIKNYPEYEDMFSVKNNLKQIDRELAKK